VRTVLNSKGNIHQQIYFYLLMLLAAALPLSIFATSVIQFLLVINLGMEGRYAEKWSRITRNRAFQVYILFYVVHILGMLWSSDLQYGLRDLKIKLPLLVIPFVVVSSEDLSIRQIRSILAAFIAGNMIGSLGSLLALLKWIPAEMDNYRNASLFISHIRFSLMIVLSIMFSVYLFFKREPGEKNYLRILYLIAMLWLPVFLVILRSLSGIVIIVLIVLFLSLLLVRTVPDRAGRFMLQVLIITIPLFLIVYIGSAVNRFYSFEQIDPNDLDSLTYEGNPYIHYPENRETENGHFVWINVCPPELEREWDKVSEYDYMGEASNGGLIRFTLIRYLTSKGLRKDAAGVRQLDSVDIRAIERGIANHIYLNRFRLYPRIYEVIWEFDRYRLGFSPNDKSLVQRYYYLRAGISIASENLLYGVGTGDVRQAFDKFYQENDSPLRLERRRGAHNQYLTLAIAFGIPGLLICLLALVLPVFMKGRWYSFMTLVFFLTMVLSMLDEDTLKNSPGAEMFGLFYALFIFGPGWRWRTKKYKQSATG